MSIKGKSDTVVENFQQTEKKGCGCFATGCFGILLLLMVLCVGSYFTAMHTSLPLAFMERAIEADGNVEIEGLSGSVSSGFEVESLKVVSDHGSKHKNEFRDVKFDFNGFYNFVRTKRLLIYEASIGGATIYAEFDENDGSMKVGKIDGDEIAREVSEGLNELKDDLEEDEFKELKELRIDLISAQNIVIVNPKTGATLKFNKAQFKNFQMLDGSVVRLGDLNVVSDQLDLETQQSKRYANQEIAWNLSGLVKPRLYKGLVRDIPFDVDFAIVNKNEFQIHLDLFGGKVEIDEPQSDHKVYKLTGFSPGEYFDLGASLVPSDWQVEVVVEPMENDSPESKEEKFKSGESGQNSVYQISISPGGSFRLGDTRFEIESQAITCGPNDQLKPAWITATGEHEGRTITARLTPRDETPFFGIELVAPDSDPQSLWVDLFFDKPFEELSSGQQLEVKKALFGESIEIGESVDF